MKQFPTVGDAVVFYPSSEDQECLTNNNSPSNGVAAIVTRDCDGGLVNLTVFPDNGPLAFRSSVGSKNESNAGSGYYYELLNA